MLKSVLQKDLPDIYAYLENNGIIPLRINSYLSAYGLDKEFVKFWYCESEGRVCGLISLFEDTLLLHINEDADVNEVVSFIEMLPFSTLSCEKETAELCGFTDTTEKQGYVYCDLPEYDVAEDIAEEKIKSAYKLICETIPDSFVDTNNAFLSFLSDYTYRKRRGFARGKCMLEDNKLVSCAFTCAETETSALLSGVATNINVRKGGYGKKTVLSLVSELSSLGKTSYVIALNKSAEGFYEHIGFVKDKTIVYINRKDM